MLLCTMSAPWPSKPMLGRYHVDLAKALGARGTRCDILCPAPIVPPCSAMLGSKVRAHAERPSHYEIDGVEIYSPRVPFAYPRAVRFSCAERAPGPVALLSRVALRGAIERAARATGAEGILAHGALPIGVAAADACGSLGIPMVVIEHSAEDVLRLTSDTPITSVYRGVYSEARAVLAVGPGMCTHLESIGVGNALLCPNGIPTDMPEAPAPGTSAGTRVLSAGHYYPRKGFETVVDAFAKVCAPDDELRIVTAAPDSLVQRIAASPAAGQIVVTGPLPRDRLVHEMRRADVFVLPAAGEAFGLVYAEALACATPVIMSDDSGFAASLEHHGVDPRSVGWTTPARDVEGTATALVEAMHDRARLHARARTGEEIVRRLFTWERAAETVAQAFDHNPSRIAA